MKSLQIKKTSVNPETVAIIELQSKVYRFTEKKRISETTRSEIYFF